MKTLYLITTRGLGGFYVLAENIKIACENLTRIFDEKKYGSYADRVITDVEILTKALGSFSSGDDLPNLSDKDARLLVVSDWEKTSIKG